MWEGKCANRLAAGWSSTQWIEQLYGNILHQHFSVLNENWGKLQWRCSVEGQWGVIWRKFYIELDNILHSKPSYEPVELCGNIHGQHLICFFAHTVSKRRLQTVISPSGGEGGQRRPTWCVCTHSFRPGNCPMLMSDMKNTTTPFTGIKPATSPSQTFSPSHSVEGVSSNVAQDAHHAAPSTRWTRKKRDNLVLCTGGWTGF